jgi:hypothetical protein
MIVAQIIMAPIVMAILAVRAVVVLILHAKQKLTLDVLLLRTDVMETGNVIVIVVRKSNAK